MGYDRKVGNYRQFLLANHRLNKDAVTRILNDYMEAVNNALIPLTGAPHYNYAWGGGAGAPWTYTLDTSTPDAPIVTFTGKHYFYFGATDPVTGYASTKTVCFDASSPAQGTVAVPLASLAATDSTGYIWVSRGEGNSVDDSEAHWNAGEAFQNTPPMRLERVDFAVTDTSPHATINQENGWFRLWYISSWSGDVPEMKFIHFLDSKGLDANADPDVAKCTDGGFATPLGYAQGLVDVTRNLTNMMHMVLSSAWDITIDGAVNAQGSEGWFKRPSRGLTELNTDLTAVEAATNTYDANFLRLQNGLMSCQPVFVFTRVSGTGSWSSIYPTDPVDTVSLGVTGDNTITFKSGSEIDSTYAVILSASGYAERAACGYFWETSKRLAVRTWDLENDIGLEARDFSLMLVPVGRVDFTNSVSDS